MVLLLQYCDLGTAATVDLGTAATVDLGTAATVDLGTAAAVDLGTASAWDNNEFHDTNFDSAESSCYFVWRQAFSREEQHICYKLQNCFSNIAIYI